MVNIICGGAGTGKTQILCKLLLDRLAENRRCYWFTPEQYGLSAEKMLCATVPDTLKKFLETVSFKRFCDLVFDETGTYPLSPSGKSGMAVVMTLALSEVASELRCFRRSVSDVGFINELVSLHGQLSDYKTDLSAFTGNGNNTAEKVEDLKLIFSAYERLSGDNAGSRATVCASVLADTKQYDGCCFFFDGFDGFTPAENDILYYILLHSYESDFTFYTDSLKDTTGGFGIFSDVISTSSRIIAFCEDSGIQHSEQYLTADEKSLSAYCEKELFEIAPKQRETCNDVHLYSSDNLFEELSCCAVVIGEKIEQGAALSDFLILSGDTSLIRPAAEAIFGEYGITYFDDSRTSVSSKPLMRFLLSVAKASAFGISPELLSVCLKSGINGAPYDEMCDFENYLDMWSIKGWQLSPDHAFIRNPISTDSTVANGTAQAALDSLNLFKKEYCDPIYRLIEELSIKKPKEKLERMFSFLDNCKASEMLAKKTSDLRLSGFDALADEEEQVWELTVRLFDELYAVLPDSDIEAVLFYNLFRASIDSLTAGSVPKSFDSVTIGGIGRTRADRTKTVFIVGANSGLLPPEEPESAVLNDYDLMLLSESGVSVPPTSENRQISRRIDVLRALTRAKEELFVFTHRNDPSGKASLPATLFNTMCAVFPGAYATFEPSRLYCCRKKLLDLYGASSSNKESAARLADLLSGDKVFESVSERISAVAELGAEKTLGSDIALRLYRRDLSFSSFERYNGCAFSFFCRYGLHIKPKERFRVDEMRIGTFIHWCLEKAFSDGRDATFSCLTDEELRLLAKNLSSEYISENLSAAHEQSERYHFLFNRLTGYLAKLFILMRDELCASEFSPRDFELDISPSGEIKPLHIPLTDGREAVFDGKVDRVDTYNGKDGTYIKVIDYKTGEKTYSLNDIINGINLQMFIYLFAIIKNGKERYGEVLRPGAVVYRHSFGKLANVSLGDGRASASVKTSSGLFINDTDVLHAFEKDLKGQFIPVKLYKDKQFGKTAPIASAERFGRLERYIIDYLGRVCSEMYDGRINVNPYDDQNISSCRYCDYRAVCGYTSDKKRLLSSANGENAWKLIEGDRTDG